VYIKDDIHYFSRESSLVIISLKKNGIGGNIYVHPEVTNIDATLIADGALMNGVSENGNIASKTWLDDQE
jgi:hypothetical protein